MRNPFRYFNSSPEVIRLVVMMYIRYPLSLRQVEDIGDEANQSVAVLPGDANQIQRLAGQLARNPVGHQPE